MAAEPDASEWKPKFSPWLIAIAVMIVAFMEVMDTSIAAVAIPNIAGSISATADEATWVLTSYLVANAVFIPASTWLSLKFGRKRYLMMSVLIFAIASFACGAASGLAFILFARAVQGAAGGALQPLSQSILIESFPPAKRGLALGMYAMGIVVAPIIATTLGGYLTDTVSWRGAFYINIPIGILALILQARGVALGTLPQKQLGNGSALINLLRNVGGSIGIRSSIPSLSVIFNHTPMNCLVPSLAQGTSFRTTCQR